MKTLQTTTRTTILLAAGALAVGYAAGGALVWFIAVGAAALAWLSAEWRGWPWLATLAFAADVWLAAYGISKGYGPVWMAAAVILALAALATGQFVRRAGPVLRDEDAPPIIWRFATRLGVLAAISLGLSLLALNLEINLTFGLAILGGMVLVFALSRIVAAVRRRSD
jgi:hypothetical protein